MPQDQDSKAPSIPINRHDKRSPAAKGVMVLSPKGKDAGTSHGSRRNRTRAVLRGNP